MTSFLIAIIVSVVVYGVVHVLATNFFHSTSNTKHMQERLKQMRGDASSALSAEQNLTQSIMRKHAKAMGGISRIFFLFPGMHLLYPKLVKAGLQKNPDKFFLVGMVTFAISIFFMKNMGSTALLVALIISFVVCYLYLGRLIAKRRKAMIDSLPDVLEMIVRSVRAGYPLNSVIGIISENMLPPISEEFKQVADEMAYGSSMIDALQRMAKRVEEPDFMFFTVVLAVQQEVGGNLAEVLSNLARLIRRRKNLRLKILAISGEGRATMWVLGALPFVMAVILNFMAPTHLDPFFDTPSGNILLAVAIGLVVSCVLIVRKIVNIKV